MPKRLTINRRDFLGGVALSTAAGALAPLDLLAAPREEAALTHSYPPALTGLRGSQPGSFDVAHSMAWGGKQYAQPQEQTDADYDLIVVGAGISGLAAAFFWRQAKGPDARILILDNHDDFGGHARRNEFTVDGQLLVGYGGSQSIDTPSAYSTVSAQLLRDVGIDTERFYGYFDQDFHQRNQLERGLYFPAEIYGSDLTLPGIAALRRESAEKLRAEDIAAYPLPAAAKTALLTLMNSEQNPLSAMPKNQRTEWLRQRSYRDFLLQTAGVPEDVYYLFRDSVRGWWGVGWDALSALEATRLGMPGTAHLDVPINANAAARDEPYIFHFPDGNAGVARALVRQLLPKVLPGETMEDLVLAEADYGQLDSPGNACRLRLNSTAVDMRHTPDQSLVDVSYVRGGKTYRSRARHAVMAGYNAMLPLICPELPAEQREAIDYATKVPLIYISVATRNWRAFAELGLHSVSVVQTDFMHSFGMDFPVSMGGVEFPKTPDEPCILHGTVIPCAPDQGYTAREQHVIGRREIYAMSWSDIEKRTLRQLDGALGAGGFDSARDVAAITANRWPHGYAYEYNDLSDPAQYTRQNGPHVLGAQQIGRISIANSDAAAYAFVDGAIDAAHRAAQEQLS